MIVWPFMLALACLPLLVWLLDRKRRAPGSGSVTTAARWPAVLRGRLSAGALEVLRPGAEVGRVTPWRFWVAIVLLLLAMTRPQWSAPEEARAPDGDEQLVILMDYSESMLAGDLPPSRLQRARRLALGLLDGVGEAPVALVGYAEAPHLLAPSSRDHAAARRLLQSMEPRHFIDQGRGLSAALTEAAKAFTARPGPKLLVLISVGEDDTPSTSAGLADLERSGVRLLAIGVGTAEGAVLAADDGRPLRDASGAPRVSRLESERLRSLAETTGGVYLNGAGRDAVQSAVREARDALMQDSRRGLRSQNQRIEPFTWLLLLAMALLAWSACTEFARGATPARRRLRRPAPTFRGAGLGVGVAVCLAALPAPGWAQAPGQLHVHDGDPYFVALSLVESLVANRNPSADDYQEFAETVADYGLFHRGHAHAVIDTLFYDGFIAIELGRELDPDNPAWAEIEARLDRLARRAPASRPPRSGAGDDANERVDADVEIDVEVEADPATDGASDERVADAEDGMDAPDAADADSRDGDNVGGGQADAFDDQEWSDPTLALPLHRLEVIRERATPADLFRARALNSKRDRPAGGREP